MKNIHLTKKNTKGGFTLLELLIVIAIIAILSVALVIVLNPAETLKKARDAQRISDLSTLKTAIGLYMTSVSPVYLGGLSDNTFCKATVLSSTAGNPIVTLTWATPAKISYSVPSATISQTTGLDGGTTGPRLLVTTPSLTDGTGWIPVNFNNIVGGSPISNLPIDPINSVTTGGSAAGAITSGALVYRYGCSQSPVGFEIDATLESDAYTLTDNKKVSDGGNSTAYYETGTNLLILGKTGTVTPGTDINNADY